MYTQEAGAAPNVKRTETIRPSEACAKEADLLVPTEAAMPRQIKRPVLTAEPQR